MNTTKEKRVLIVEDALLQAKVAITFFKKLGYEADHTMDGNEAVELVKKNHYALVYMDIGLNGISGDEAFKLIRKYEQENNLEPTPIVAVTANNNPEELNYYKELGMQDAISKPLDIKKAEHILSFGKK